MTSNPSKIVSDYTSLSTNTGAKDILDGCLSSLITKPISGETFFNNDEGYPITIPATGGTLGTIDNDIVVFYTGYTNTGVHPFYDAIYHNIINGYAHFDITDATNF